MWKQKTHTIIFIVFVDDLPLWGRVGRTVDNEIETEQDNADTDDDGAPAEYIYTHKIFTIGYNDDRVREKVYKNPSSIIPADSTIIISDHWD